MARPDVDETVREGESPSSLVSRLSLEKARAVLARRPDSVIVAADTVVVAEGQVLGKPRDEADAARMLRALSGRTHEVWTGVSILGGADEPAIVVCTRVVFRELDDEEIARYAAGGEPMDKAGAYAIQGGAAGFVARIEGSYTNVVGLPLAETVEALRQLGCRAG